MCKARNKVERSPFAWVYRVFQVSEVSQASRGLVPERESLAERERARARARARVRVRVRVRGRIGVRVRVRVRVRD